MAEQLSLTPRVIGVQLIDHDGSDVATDSYSPYKAGTVTVWTFWGGPQIDRPQGLGYLCSNRLVAERLRCAINAGVVFTDPTLERDINGKTYVQARSHVLGKRMNADLRRLGF